jgi:hypothetical protein
MAKSKRNLSKKAQVQKLRKVGPDLRVPRPPASVETVLSENKSLVPTKLTTTSADIITS